MNDKRSQFSVMNDILNAPKKRHNMEKDSFSHKPDGFLVFNAPGHGVKGNDFTSMSEAGWRSMSEASVMINVILIKLRLSLKYLAEIEEWIQTIANCLLRQKETTK